MEPRVDVHLSAADIRAALAADVAGGLTSAPKELPPKWFYDERGSKLFDEITRLPEYYPTRCERAILQERAADIAALTMPHTVVELGSGTSDKTGLLLQACEATGQLRRFIPFDVSEPVLRQAAAALARAHPAIEIRAVAGDFERHLDRIPPGGRRLVVFLGGTIGNFNPKQRAQFLGDLVRDMTEGDALLLGTDLVKDRRRLEAAYNDAAGVTAAFNRNVLRVINRELGADFVEERFEHVARFDTEEEWIELSLRATSAHKVTVAGLGDNVIPAGLGDNVIPAGLGDNVTIAGLGDNVIPAGLGDAGLGLAVHFHAGEKMRTEISAKFRRSGVEAELAGAGLALARWWTDPAGEFALSLSFRE